MFKVGDKVWCLTYGWGVVDSIYEDKSYPVSVIFENKGNIVVFTLEGKRFTYALRELFFDEIPIPKRALERPRKTAKEMFDECEEVEFKKGCDNYYIYTKLLENRVFKGCCNYMFTYGLKYISKEDAERIVEECKENNREV